MTKLRWPIKWSAISGRWRKLSSPAKAGVGIGAVVVALVVLYLLYSVYFLGQIYPRVTVGGQTFGGLTRSEAHDKLAGLAQSNQPIKLIYQDQSTTLSPSDVSWRLDVDKTTDALYQVGRNSSFWQNTWQRIKAPLTQHEITPVVSYDATTLDSQLTAFTKSIDQPAANASAKFVNDKLVITPEKVGRRIDHQAVESTILAAWTHFRGDELTLVTTFDVPTVVVGDQAALQARVNQLSQKKLTLHWDGGDKSLALGDIHKLIDFVGDTNSKNANGQETLTAAFTDDQTKSFLQDLADGINQPAKEPRLAINNGVLTVSSPAQQGRSVDIDASVASVMTALNGDATTADLTLKNQDPTINENNLASLGIKERIGFGQTSFAGSPSNRIQNITHGVQLLNGAIVKPGDEFSTVNTLGRVDDTTGFLPELVIKENKTVPEFGGGLCQVSTTLFRSVMNAGLKVTERQNHSYRVSYYEPPIGLDATIYLPKPDFKFLNDTPGYILIQAHVDGNKVTFELWGTSDGRSSEISTPQVLSTTPAGDPIYTDTDTLPTGTVKQTEHAHDGAVATATYTVTRNGQVINKQTFKSIYKPWPAQFLRGTGPNQPTQ